MLSRIVWVTSIVAFAVTAVPLGAALAEETASQSTKEASVGKQREAAMAVYKARNLGIKLYAEKKYDEAYPHLMTAATHGFKKAQAQLGFMHLNGLGGAKKDTRFAVGWLGVAAEGVTEPNISKFFKEVWKSIPAENTAAFQLVVDKFVANYGTEVNDVKCRRVNKSGSKIRKVRCQIYDPDGRVISDAVGDVFRGSLGSTTPSVGGGPR